MKPYHKIPTLYKRDPENNFKTLLWGNYATPAIEYLSKNLWVFTEKVDGTNIRVMFDGNHIVFGARTDRAQIPKPLLLKLEEIFTPKLDIFKEKFGGVSVYMEKVMALK